MSEIRDSSAGLAELPGLYGAFTFPEKLLQKIWLQGDFDEAEARLPSGELLHVVHAGKWNLLGGPDFTDARIRLGGARGRELHGDVEVHLWAHDWNVHGHARDPAYDRVMLHVVLFPPPPGHVTYGAQGRVIPTIALLPLLHRGLEEFAADEAVEVLANRPLARLPEELATMTSAEVVVLLREHAQARWRQKLGYARIRLEKLGWEGACHHTALEVLGFRFNRAPMLRVAGLWPLAAWREPGFDPLRAFGSVDNWSLQGVRPINHPRVRLQQYARWCALRPDWPAAVRALLGAWTGPADVDPLMPTREVRRQKRFPARRAQLAADICAEVVGGSRLNTLVCDGLMPLFSAEADCSLEQAWFHWFPGDLPHWLTAGLRQLGYFDGRTQPASHGMAQGLLGWLLARERRL